MAFHVSVDEALLLCQEAFNEEEIALITYTFSK